MVMSGDYRKDDHHSRKSNWTSVRCSKPLVAAIEQPFGKLTIKPPERFTVSRKIVAVVVTAVVENKLKTRMCSPWRCKHTPPLPTFCVKKSQSISQEAQLILTNLRDAFIGQSRSPNIVPFHILGIVSDCATVTLSFRQSLFTIFDFKKIS